MKMGIGADPDYYNGNNKEEDKRVKLGERVQGWWESFDEIKKEEMLESYTWKSDLLSYDEFWESLDWEDKLDIYYSDLEKDHYYGINELI